MNTSPLQTNLAFPIRDALRHELSWAHNRKLQRMSNGKVRSA